MGIFLEVLYKQVKIRTNEKFVMTYISFLIYSYLNKIYLQVYDNLTYTSKCENNINWHL